MTSTTYPHSLQSSGKVVKIVGTQIQSQQKQNQDKGEHASRLTSGLQRSRDPEQEKWQNVDGFFPKIIAQFKIWQPQMCSAFHCK